MENGAPLDAVNDKGWMPVTVADGVEYTPAVLKRYPGSGGDAAQDDGGARPAGAAVVPAGEGGGRRVTLGS